MGFRSRLIVFGYPLAEVLVLWAVASLIGWGWALLGLLAGFPIGLALMRNAGNTAAASVQAGPERTAQLASSMAGQFAAGVLFFIPGYLTDLVGALLLLPGVRAGVGRWMARRFHQQTWYSRFPGSGDVIRGTVIVEDTRVDDLEDLDEPDDDHPPPELGR
jgi:UPF0716 protein FxsA